MTRLRRLIARLCDARVAELERERDEAIDKATGRLDRDLDAFVGFVWEYVWCRLPREAHE